MNKETVLSSFLIGKTSRSWQMLVPISIRLDITSHHLTSYYGVGWSDWHYRQICASICFRWYGSTCVIPSVGYPSCLQTTIASAEFQPSSQTVPHTEPRQTSTRPSKLKFAPVKLMSPSLHGAIWRNHKMTHTHIITIRRFWTIKILSVECLKTSAKAKDINHSTRDQLGRWAPLV